MPAPFAVLLLGLGLCGPADDPIAGEPERRALAYLAREVPNWSKENRCFSCHNNGDAARALMIASKTPFAARSEALSDTLDWLAHPEKWDRNGGDGPFSDQKLARLQFAHALAVAVETGGVGDRTPLIKAAESVAADQEADGSWPSDAATVGSPATYGKPLATAIARRTLNSADPKRFSGAIDRADGWIRSRPVVNVLDAASVLLALPKDEPVNRGPRLRAFEVLRRAQGESGGFGPYVRSAAEPFDTALVLLVLREWPDRREVAPMIRRGRRSLIASQREDGSWPETTRPARGESYAQRLSTAGWATLALLTTREPL